MNKIIKNILEKTYEGKFVTTEENFPTINIEKNNLKEICILLHNNIHINNIKKILNIGDVEMKNRLSLLEQEGLLKNNYNSFLPTFMIISIEEAEIIKNTLVNIKQSIIELIINKLDEIKEKVLSCLVDIKENESININYDIKSILEKLGFIKEGKVNIPILDLSEYNDLSGIADIIKDEYIEILNANKESIYKEYKLSQYYNEVTFNEYFMWWYHIFYTEVTNELIRLKYIEMPSYENFSYMVIK